MAATETATRAAGALDDLYRNHVAEVYRYAYAVLGNRADAEDVTQTTFVNALRALERGVRPRKPGNWLIVITHNIVRQRFRYAQSHPIEVTLDRDVAAGSDGAEDGPTLAELMRALQRIPPSQREAIVMRELEGRSYKEIAEILGLSTGALETLLFRARRSIAEELESSVTCDEVEMSLSQQLDGRLGRKQRRRLDDHLAHCPSCTRLAGQQRKHQRAFKGLALVPLPLSLTLFKGTPPAAAATSLPVIGTATGATASVTGAGAGGATAGGILASAAVVKVAAVVAAVGVAGAVGYQSTRAQEAPPARTPSRSTTVPNVERHETPRQRAATSPASTLSATARLKSAAGTRHDTPHKSAAPSPAGTSTAAGRRESNTSSQQGNANGARRAQLPTGSVRGATAPGQLKKTMTPELGVPGAKHTDAKKPKKPKQPRMTAPPHTGRLAEDSIPAVATKAGQQPSLAVSTGANDTPPAVEPYGASQTHGEGK